MISEQTIHSCQSRKHSPCGLFSDTLEPFECKSQSDTKALGAWSQARIEVPLSYRHPLFFFDAQADLERERFPVVTG